MVSSTRFPGEVGYELCALHFVRRGESVGL